MYSRIHAQRLSPTTQSKLRPTLWKTTQFPLRASPQPGQPQTTCAGLLRRLATGWTFCLGCSITFSRAMRMCFPHGRERCRWNSVPQGRANASATGRMKDTATGQTLIMPTFAWNGFPVGLEAHLQCISTEIRQPQCVLRCPGDTVAPSHLHDRAGILRETVPYEVRGKTPKYDFIRHCKC